MSAIQSPPTAPEQGATFATVSAVCSSLDITPEQFDALPASARSILVKANSAQAGWLNAIADVFCLIDCTHPTFAALRVAYENARAAEGRAEIPPTQEAADLAAGLLRLNPGKRFAYHRDGYAVAVWSVELKRWQCCLSRAVNGVWVTLGHEPHIGGRPACSEQDWRECRAGRAAA